MTTPITAPITDEALAEIKAGLEGGASTMLMPRLATVASMIARIEAAEAAEAGVKALQAWQHWSQIAHERRDRVKRLEEALGDCAEWFRGYGDSHAAKGDADKATRNYDRERRARAALEGE